MNEKVMFLNLYKPALVDALFNVLSGIMLV